MRAATRTAVELAVIAAGVYCIGARAGAFTGVPEGYDATGHLSKAQFITSNWPHVAWNYEWYSGQPTFAGSYPPGYHVLVAFVAWAGHVSLRTAMNAVTFAALVMVVAGLYAIVRAATGSRIAGLFSAGLLLSAPTLWAQNVVLGLYPRFTALAFLAPAVASAVVHARRGGRIPALGTCVLLCAALSMHPIVGALALCLVGAVHLLNPRQSVGARTASGVAVLAASLASAAYFYLPLALDKRSQGLFTDHEISLSWRSLVGQQGRSMDGLPLVLAPLAAVLVVVAARLLWRPQLSLTDRKRLGIDVAHLSRPSLHGPIPDGATAQVARYFAWYRLRDRVGYPLRIALLFAVVTLAFLAYGFIGTVYPRFPYYINGLQPTDLLVYPAFLLAGCIGLVGGPLMQLARPRWSYRAVRLVPSLLMAGAAVLIVVWPALAVAHQIGPARWANDTPVQAARVSMLPAAASGQREYRVAGASDSTTAWINEISATPQTRGYNDHGALHLDWQYWLEDSLQHAAASTEQRDFLLDWYGVKWVDTDTDSGSDEASQYDDPSRFRLLSSTTDYATLSSYEYRRARPILTPSNTASVLVVGDAQHYDLVLRALAFAAVDTRQLIIAHGPTAIDDLTTAQLDAFDALVVYGATVRSAAHDATLLRDYVTAGGGLFVDDADNAATVRAVAARPDSPLPAAATSPRAVTGPGWAWSTHGDPLTEGTDLAAFAAASYAGSNQWQVTTAAALKPWAHAVLDTHGATVLASGHLGRGTVIWSGIGLPYHVNAFSSRPEAEFLARLVHSVTGAEPRPVPEYHATFVNSGHRRIVIDGTARGVLLKEQLAPDWHVTVNGRAAPVYLAGPGMMWVPLPGGTTGPVVVEFGYTLSPVEKLGYLVSGVAAAVLLTLLLSRRAWRYLQRRRRRIAYGVT